MSANPSVDRPRLQFENDEMPCAPCGKSTPHRLFGNLWRCSECGGVSSTCALFPAADRPASPFLPSDVQLLRDVANTFNPDTFDEHNKLEDLADKIEAVLSPAADRPVENI